MTGRDPRESALELASSAENQLLEEYEVWRRSWERNPTMEAMAQGVKAIRALRRLVESTPGSVTLRNRDLGGETTGDRDAEMSRTLPAKNPRSVS